MSGEQILAWLVAAVLLFWAVGAHNRLVALRAALLRAFAPVDQQFQLRQALLRELADVLAPTAGDDGSVARLRAAIAQAESACTQARARPGAGGTITSLRLAEEILEQSRAGLGGRLLMPELADQLAALSQADAALAFARRQFNDSVQAYNEAVSQFPTWLLAGLFRFRRGGLL